MSMKKKSTIIALAVLVATSVSAQTVYDAANIISKDLNGTARFVGMGGAMGALGGDISTIGTNPKPVLVSIAVMMQWFHLAFPVWESRVS